MFTGHEVSLVSALAAGILSFLSPCVLPLVPAYLSFLAGTSIADLKTNAAGVRGRVLRSAVAFVLGFSLVFILLGATATTLGRWLSGSAFWLERAAGAAIAILGLHLTGLFRIPFLMREQRLHPNFAGAGLGQAFGVGAAFAFGWTPCVGPILAGILALAGTQETLAQGIVLLGAYSAGLGLPFIAAALAINPFLAWMKRWQRFFRWVEIGSGLLLLAVGAVMLAGRMAQVSAWFGGLSGLAL